MFRVRLVLAAIMAVVCVQTVLRVPVAFGAEGALSQNPEIVVSLTLPETATLGDTVAATVSISNTSSRLQSIAVTGVWVDPAGEATITNRTGLLLPGQTVTRVIDYVVNDACLPGLHELTVSVEGRAGASSATAAVEVI